MKKNTPLPLRPLWPGLGDAYPLPPVNPSLNQYVGNWSVIQQSIVLKIIGICESYSKELNIEGFFEKYRNIYTRTFPSIKTLQRLVQ
jgi:transposase